MVQKKLTNYYTIYRTKMIYSSRLGFTKIPDKSYPPFGEKKDNIIYAVYKALKDKSEETVISDVPSNQSCPIIFS